MVAVRMGHDEVLASRLAHYPRVGPQVGQCLGDLLPEPLEGRCRAGEVQSGEVRIGQGRPRDLRSRAGRKLITPEAVPRPSSAASDVV